jgi:heptosyltransferase-1
MLSLNDMAKTLKNAQAVVSVDTGLSHVAAALEVPMVVLYRVTDPKLIGADGQLVSHLVSPLAPAYIKKFTQPSQPEESLVNLSVDDVLQSLPI